MDEKRTNSQDGADRPDVAESGDAELPVTGPSPVPKVPRRALPENDTCLRAEDEDDDGYDPFSDRRPKPEPTFESDPWD